MVVSNLVLFGKHPAWSDHMFISNDTSASHQLKRVFYDHSVIPALQGGKGDQRISEEWSFLVFIDGRVFFIVNAVSRDSVGRRRFPLIAAYPLPPELKLEAALGELRELKQELLSLLNEMLTFSSEDLNEWQEAVTKTAESFQSKVDWSLVDSDEVRCELKRDAIASLMSRLSDDYDALDLKSCSFMESCSFVSFGLKQFGLPIPAMLIFDQDYNGLGLFFAIEDGSSFHLKRHLYGNLTSLTVSKDNIPPKISRLLNSLPESSESLLSIDEVPSLKLSAHHSFFTKKILIITISLFLVGLMLLGLIGSCSGSRSTDQAGVCETDPGQSSNQQKWVANATAYVEWIQPLIAFANDTSTSLNDFDSVSDALAVDLNPFAAVKANEVSMDLAKNPSKQFLTTENIYRLETIYANIDQLRTALTDYYEKQYSNELLKELKRQNYPLPSFIDVDFSQQPLLPSFGPGLVNQLKSYTTSRGILNEIVVSTKGFWNAIIKPLHEICPKHAKYTQRYVQNLIRDSNSLEQFQSQYTALLKIFGYPDFIKMDTLNEGELSEDADWINLLEQEASMESLHRLVELLEANQKDGSSRQPVDGIKLPDNTIKKPSITAIKESVDAATKSMNTVEGSLSEQLVPLNLEEWDSLLEAKLTQFQDAPFFSEVKDHAEAIRLQVLGDATLGGSQATQKIQEQTNQLLTAFQRLDVDSIKDASPFHSEYLEKTQNVKHLSDYMFAEYQAANIDSGDLESVDEVSQEISLNVNKRLTSLNKSFTDLKAIYFSNQSEGSDVRIGQKINAITQNPLYFEGGLGSQFEIVKTAVLDNAIAVETAQDLIWYTENLMSNNGITKAQLSAVTGAFNNLTSDAHTDELSEIVRQAFDAHVQKVRTTTPEDLLDIYEDLTAYLPSQLHMPQDEGLEQIAAYWRRCRLDQGFEIPTREELESLKVSTESPKVRQFYEGLLAEYDEVNLQSSGNTLDTIRKASGVKSVSVNDEDLRTEVTFEGISEKVVFLPLKTEKGTFLVQQKPLSLEQYIKLSAICDFDTEYYLTLQDSFWPRSFEVGMGLGFSTLSEWQFRNKDIFAPLAAFNRITLPAHLNEPEQVLRMASFFGFRLLEPEECTAFVRLAKSSSSLRRLAFSADDKERLASADTIQSSVYARLIAESIGRDEWSGGINFEREDSGGGQFFDVVGGSAELAYDGIDFYACGGSWLYEPLVPEELVRITEPQRIYIDVGIRFAMEAPAQKFNTVVQKTALQILSESE